MKEVKPRVRCNWCEWEGTEDELDIVADAANYELEVCPVCGRDDCLMDLNWDEVYGNRGDRNE